MKATVLPTRNHGVAYPRWELKQVACHIGELEIMDTRENGLNRIVKVATLATDYGIRELLEVHVVWMTGDKFCLSGFERKNLDGKLTDFAQSWICLIEGDKGRDNENMLHGQRENWRQ